MNRTDPSLPSEATEQRSTPERPLDEALPSYLVRVVSWALRATLFPRRTVQLAQGRSRR